MTTGQVIQLCPFAAVLDVCVEFPDTSITTWLYFGPFSTEAEGKAWLESIEEKFRSFEGLFPHDPIDKDDDHSRCFVTGTFVEAAIMFKKRRELIKPPTPESAMNEIPQHALAVIEKRIAQTKV